MRRIAVAVTLAGVGVLMLGWGIAALLEDPSTARDSDESWDLEDLSRLSKSAAQPLADLEIKASDGDSPTNAVSSDPEQPPGIEIVRPVGEPNLFGTVRHATTGSACPGALVQLFQLGRSVRTRSDESGRFALPQLASGPGTLLAWDENTGGLATLGPLLLRIEPYRGLELELEPPRTLKGVVVDAVSGVHLGEAQVRIVPSELARSVINETFAWEPVASALDGRFLIEDCPATQEIELEVTCRGYVKLRETLPLTLIDDRSVEGGVRLSLERGAIIPGIVLAKSGEPVPGSQVYLSRKTKGQAPIFDHTRTIDDGSFQLEYAPAGSGLEASAFHPEHGLTTRALEDRVAGDSTPIELRFVEPAVIVGRVRNSDDEPMPKVSVRLETPATLPADVTRVLGHRARTDAAGRFRFQHVPPGRSIVLAETTGQVTGRPVTLEAGGEVEIEIVVATLGTISGQVQEVDGTPVAGAQIHSASRPPRSVLAGAVDLWLERDETLDPKPSTVWTDDAGQFTFRTPLRRGKVTLVVSGKAIATKYVNGIAVGTTDLIIQVDSGATLRLEARIEGTTLPVERVTVKFDRRTSSEFLSPDGVYELPSLPKGQYSLEITSPGFLPVPRRQVQLHAGQTTTLNLELAPAASLSGAIRSSSGEPVGGVRVYVTDVDANARYLSEQKDIRTLSRELAQQRLPRDALREAIRNRFPTQTGNPVKSVRSNADGSFRFVALRPGRYQLTIASSSSSLLPPEEVWLTAGAEESREIVLEANAHAEVQVLSDEQQAIDDASVRLSGGPARLSLYLRVSGDGVYASGPILPGTYRLRVSKRGYNTINRNVTVEAHGDLHEPVRLEKRR